MNDQVTMLDGAVGPLALRNLTPRSGSADVLLIAHANGFHGQCYRAFADAIGTGIRIYALDFRAHGLSVAPAEKEGFAWVGMTEDAATAIAHLRTTNLGRLHGFGHSLGGAALIDLERQEPGTFASLFAFEPVLAPRDAFEADSYLTRSAEGRLRSFPSKAAALMRYGSRPPLGLFRADVLVDYVEHGFRENEDGSVTLRCLPESEAEVYRQGAQTIHFDQASDVRSEITIGRSGDGGLPAQLASPIVDKLAKGRLLDFPTITHFGPLQDPVVVAHAMRNLIDG